MTTTEQACVGDPEPTTAQHNTPILEQGELMDGPGAAVYHRPNCNCHAAAWSRGWMFWTLGVACFAFFVIECSALAEPRMWWSFAPLTLLTTWSMAQDTRSAYTGRWWRKPRTCALILTALMMLTIGALHVAPILKIYKTDQEPRISAMDERYIPVTDLPANAWVPKDRVILIAEDDDK